MKLEEGDRMHHLNIGKKNVARGKSDKLYHSSQEGKCFCSIFKKRNLN